MLYNTSWLLTVVTLSFVVFTSCESRKVSMERLPNSPRNSYYSKPNQYSPTPKPKVINYGKPNSRYYSNPYEIYDRPYYQDSDNYYVPPRRYYGAESTIPQTAVDLNK